jgi:hypothetical protein
MADLKKHLPVFLAALLGAALVRFTYPEPVQAQSSDGGRRYVAVTGPFQDGVSLLYVLDQTNDRLMTYEGKGGAANSRKVSLVGVRNIGLDSQLDGFNDESEYSYQELRELLERRGVIPR